MAIYYNEFEQPIIYNTGRPINHGSHAKIYRLDDETCLKIFTYPWDIYDKEMFKRYMGMNLDNFYKIFGLLYNKNERIKGYTMSSCENTVDDILAMPTDYLITNFDGIFRSVAKLSDANIEIDDMIPSNLILGDNTITAIDIDGSRIRDMDKQMLYEFNKIKVCVCLLRLFKATLMQRKYNDVYSNGINRINELFYPMNYDVISKKLIKYHYPIDYLMDTKGRNI